MKKLILFVLTAFLFISCTAVKFENPQPTAAPSLSEFPEKMHGTFVSDSDDTLEFSQNHFRYSSGTEVNLESKLSPESAVLKKANNTYILSLKDEQGWDVFPMKLGRNKITIYYANLDPDAEQLILDLKNTSPVHEIRNEEGKFDHYLIDPSEKEFKKLLRKKLFSEEIVFKRLN